MEYSIRYSELSHVDDKAMSDASRAELAGKTQKFGATVQLATIPLKFQSGWQVGLLKSQVLAYNMNGYIMHSSILLVTQ